MLPAWKTTPNNAVLQAAGTIPAAVWLKNNAKRTVVRLRRLDPTYPTAKRAAEEPKYPFKRYRDRITGPRLSYYLDRQRTRL